MLLSAFLTVISFFFVAFGQPAWIWEFGVIAYFIGFALIGAVIFNLPTKKAKFYLGTGWFTAVQLVQLSWSISHPYLYIYSIYFLVSLIFGLQFGWLATLITRERINKLSFPFMMAAAWTVMEWLRLFLFTGLPWNPIGLSVTELTYPTLFASVGGIYLLSFTVMFINMLALQAWKLPKKIPYATAYIILSLVPFAYGWLVLNFQEESESIHLNTLVVQTATPIEEMIPFSSPQQNFNFVFEEWRHILRMLQPHAEKGADLIVFPENTVPHGTFWPIYRYEEVQSLFKGVFGEQAITALPDLSTGSAMQKGDVWLVSNGYITQALSNLFESEIVIGLEDVEANEKGEYQIFNAAFHFQPHSQTQERYDKRVLVPVGEYLPFEWCRLLARQYGICGSMTPGEKPVVVKSGKVPMGLTICYEEAYGHLMRENKLEGAQLLINLTNDGWYPNSRLPRQHSDHARLRAVEMGIPHVRSSNTGSSGVFDCFGRCYCASHPEAPEFLATPEVLNVDLPIVHRSTLYTQVGDGLVIGLSMLILFFNLRRK